MMRKVFVAATMLPVSSVIAVLARAHGADEEFASEAVGRDDDRFGLCATGPALHCQLCLIHRRPETLKAGSGAFTPIRLSVCRPKLLQAIKLNAGG